MPRGDRQTSRSVLPARPSARQLDAIGWTTTSSTYVALGYRFRFRTNNPTLGDFLIEAFASFPTDQSTSTDPTEGSSSTEPTTYSIVDRGDTGNRFIVMINGDRDALVRGEFLAIAAVTAHIDTSVVEVARRRFLCLHAAAVAIDGRAIVFPGASGRGKSTLCAALVASGHRYLSDEVAAIDLVTGLVHPYPRPIIVRFGSWTHLQDRFNLSRDIAPFSTDRWLLGPHRLGNFDTSAEPAPLAALCAIRYDALESDGLSTLEQAAAAMHIVEHAFNFETDQTGTLSSAATLSSRTPVYRLSYRTIDEALAVVGRLQL